MNVEQEVAERRLTAVLEEACGHGVPHDLAARVRGSLSQSRGSAVPRRGAVMPALLMAAAMAVVIVIASWHTRAAPLQQPSATQDTIRKVTITTAMVRAACVAVASPPAPGEAGARLLALANGGPCGVVVAPGVRGESRTDLAGLTWHEAVTQVAADAGARVEDHGDVVLVVPGEPVPLERTRCFAPGLPFVDIGDLPKLLQRACGVDLVVGADCSGQIALDVRGVPVRALLQVIANQLSLQLVGCGTVLVLRRPVPAPPARRVALNLTNCTMGQAIDAWTTVAGGNIVVAPGVAGVASVRAVSREPDALLAALAAAVGAEVVAEERGILRVVPRLAAAATATMTADHASLDDAARAVALPAGLLVVAADAARSRAQIAVSDADTLDVLRAVAMANGRRWLRRDREYTVQ
jgi:hypothetical protein